VDLPVELEHAHNMFHASQHKEYIPDLGYAIVTQCI